MFFIMKSWKKHFQFLVFEIPWLGISRLALLDIFFLIFLEIGNLKRNYFQFEITQGQLVE